MNEFLDLDPTRIDVPPTLAAQVTGQCGPDPASISAAMPAAFASLMAGLQQHRLSPSGPPRVIYTAHGPQGTSFILAIPILPPSANPPAGAPLTVSTLPGTRAVRFLHRGPYRDLMRTYGRVTDWMKREGLLQTDADWARYMPMWEEYVNDPQTTPEPDLRTYIYIPLL